jgi:hypothetical protein
MKDNQIVLLTHLDYSPFVIGFDGKKIYVGQEVIYISKCKPAWARDRFDHENGHNLKKGIVEEISENKKSIKINGSWFKKLTNVVPI